MTVFMYLRLSLSPWVISLRILILGIVLAATVLAKDKVLDPKEVWEKALAAKGGRELLDSVESLNESSLIHVSLGLLKIPTGESEALYVFPSKEWLWFDERGYNSHLIPQINVRQLDRSVWWWVVQGLESKPDSKVLTRHLMDFRVQMLQKQLGLFLESPDESLRFLSAVERRNLSGCKLLLKAAVSSEIVVEYEFDCKSYLASKITLTYPYPIELMKTWPKVGKDGKPQQPPTESKISVEYQDYKQVDGIMLPHTVTERKHRVFVNKIQYKINPEYSKEIFETPPGTDFGRYDWKPKPPPLQPK